MRRRLQTLIIGTLLVTTIACTGETTPDDTLRFGLSSVPINLDPRYATDATSERLNRLLYQSLVDFDDHLQPKPGLARWERRSPTQYRFTLLKPWPAFVGGALVSAADVKATYDSILSVDNASPHRGNLANIVTISTHGEDIIDFFLKAPDPLFPGRLVIGILPAKLIAAGHAFSQAPVGTGPFRYRAWPQTGQLRLIRSRDEQKFEFLTVKDPTVRVLKLLSGEIDMMQNDLQPELLTYLRDQQGVNVREGKASRFTYLGFNLEDPLMGRKAVRRAIAHGIDRASIIRYVFGGAARPANALLPPEHWAGHPSLETYDYDPEKAIGLLREAGFPANKPLKVVYKTSSDPFRIRIATIIQHQLGKIGIDVDVQSFDWGTFYGDIKAGRFQMYSLSWVGVKTPDIFRYIFHSDALPPDGANRGRFRDAHADALIEVAEMAPTAALQANVFRALQDYLWQQLPYVPLWYEDNVFVARNDIKGYSLALDGNIDALGAVYRAR